MSLSTLSSRSSLSLSLSRWPYQVNGMALSIGQIIAISITATAASIGAAGIPQVEHFPIVSVSCAHPFWQMQIQNMQKYKHQHSYVYYCIHIPGWSRHHGDGSWDCWVAASGCHHHPRCWLATRQVLDCYLQEKDYRKYCQCGHWSWFMEIIPNKSHLLK